MRKHANLYIAGLCLVLALSGIIYSTTVVVPEMQAAALQSSATHIDPADLGIPDMSMTMTYEQYSANNIAVNTEPMAGYYKQMRLMDWFVPLTYGGLLAALMWSLHPRIRRPLLLFPLFSILCDYSENVILTSVTGAPSTDMFHVLQVIGILKFALSGIGLVAYIVALLCTRKIAAKTGVTAP